MVEWGNDYREASNRVSKVLLTLFTLSILPPACRQVGSKGASSNPFALLKWKLAAFPVFQPWPYCFPPRRYITPQRYIFCSGSSCTYTICAGTKMA
jgi:hypothetical protein